MSEPQADTVELADGGEPLETLLERDPIELAGDKDKPDAAARGRELLGIYLSDIAKVPLLTPEEEQELARRVQEGDADAERRLTEANLRLVVRVARRYLNRGLSLLDLIEEGNLGLLQAVKKFQPGRGTRFPTTEEIAKALDHPLEEIEHIERMSQRPVSLDAPPVPGGTGSVEDAVADSAPPPGAGLAAALRAREDLAEVLRDLPDSERNVLGWRFGLTGEEPMTLEAIGRKLGVTRERVRQIESAALGRLRRLMAARGMEAQDLF